MSSGTTTTNAGGIGFPAALALLFIGLKLGHVIDWPWIWVLSPLWLGLALVAIIITTMLLVLAIERAYKR